MVVSRIALFVLLFVNLCSLDPPHFASASTQKVPVTYYKDVEPILRDQCVECHRDGQIGPFPLVKFADTERRARQIANVTGSRFMPPWNADAGSSLYRHSRKLTDAQIQILRSWYSQGAPRGTPVARPLAPLHEEPWPDGKPDMVVSLKTPFSIAQDGPDVYHRFVIPLNLTEDRWIRRAVFHPITPRIIRLAMLSLDGTGLTRKIAARQGGNGYTSMVGQLLPTTDNFGTWAPGCGPEELPSDVGVFASRRSDLLALVRLHPDGKPEQAQFEVGIYFAHRRPDTQLTSIVLRVPNLFIPPGRKDFIVSDSFLVPVDVRAFSVFAHAHLLCKSIRVTYTTPHSPPRELLKISNWTPNWQLPYTFIQPVLFPAGTRIDAEFTYDNTSPPPPETIFSGSVNDEMAYLQIQTAPARIADLAVLRSAITTRLQKQQATPGK